MAVQSGSSGFCTMIFHLHEFYVTFDFLENIQICIHHVTMPRKVTFHFTKVTFTLQLKILLFTLLKKELSCWSLQTVMKING